MKKLMKMLLIALFAVPFVVSAKEYTPGEIVNFVTTDAEYQAMQGGDWSVGQRSVIIGASIDANYVRALTFGAAYNTSAWVDTADYKSSFAYRRAVELVNSKGMVDPYIKPVSDTANLDFITLDELKTVFGADFTANPEVGTISVEQWKDVFAGIGLVLAGNMPDPASGANVKTGFYTGTVEGDKVWVVELDMTTTGSITGGDLQVLISGIEVKKVLRDTTDVYFVMPVLNYGKEYDCHYTPEESKHCYKCGTDNFIWVKDGTQGEGCTIVPTVTKEEDCIPTPKTGVADYALEIIGLVAVGTCLMIILKKKDFFVGA